MLLVNQIIPFSNVDGDGNRCSIFLQQCNIHCEYCHNQETINLCTSCGKCVEICPVGALRTINGKVIYDIHKCINCDQCITVCANDSTPKAKLYTTDDILNRITEYLPYIRGITVSGGEPLLQEKGIIELFKKMSHMNISKYIDTNCFMDMSQMYELISLTDGFMVDIKADRMQMELCAAESKYSFDNLAMLLEQNKVIEVRTVIFNGLVDVSNVILKLSKYLKKYPLVRYRLIKGHLTGLSDDKKKKLITKVPTDEEMLKYKTMAQNNGIENVIING